MGMRMCVYVYVGVCIGEGVQGKRGVRDLQDVVWCGGGWTAMVVMDA